MKESELIDKEEQKRQNARTFINAAQEMIESEGLENISVRKIAQKAGFHNSTIYLYFEDLDQLAMFASLKYFREYSHSLELQSQKNLSPTENFLSIWELLWIPCLRSLIYSTISFMENAVTIFLRS